MARVPYLDKSDLAPENQDLLARSIMLHRALAHSPNGLQGLRRARPVHPPQEPARSAPARACYPAGRLSRARALRVVAPRQDRPRIRRHRRRHPRPDRGDGGQVEQARAAGEAGAEGRARDDQRSRRLRGDVCGAAQGPRQRAHRRPRHHHLVLQRGGAAARQLGNRCRARVPALSRRVSAARLPENPDERRRQEGPRHPASGRHRGDPARRARRASRSSWWCATTRSISPRALWCFPAARSTRPMPIRPGRSSRHRPRPHPSAPSWWHAARETFEEAGLVLARRRRRRRTWSMPTRRTGWSRPIARVSSRAIRPFSISSAARTCGWPPT